MEKLLIDTFNKGLVTVFVGAGISTLEPSCLPSWWQLNHAILDALAHEAESLTPEVNRIKDFIIDRENKGILPPEFVAEIITSRVGLKLLNISSNLKIN